MLSDYDAWKLASPWDDAPSRGKYFGHYEAEEGDLEYWVYFRDDEYVVDDIPYADFDYEGLSEARKKSLDDEIIEDAIRKNLWDYE